jgi:unsaturated rhamnogalacturonyl hydrolase
VAHAEELVATHPRDTHGIFGKLDAPDKIWIDSAFAVCPFLAIVGRLANRREFIDEACHQMTAMHAALLDRSNGLYHQSLNFAGPGKLSQDHWSRGNGWAALPLADLSVELPEDHPERPCLRAMFLEHMQGCVRAQDAQGLWHQELTDHESYVETSGTGLILYGMGRGLEHGLLPESFRESFLRGLRGYLSYIAMDGSVSNTCVGCLCPGDGSIDAYKAKPWKLNDPHAFGPVVLAFAQALKLGIQTVEI